jgi:hypothetical protein
MSWRPTNNLDRLTKNGEKIQVLSSGKRLNHSHKSYGLDLYEYEFVEMVIERKKGLQ